MHIQVKQGRNWLFRLLFGIFYFERKPSRNKKNKINYFVFQNIFLMKKTFKLKRAKKSSKVELVFESNY